MREYVVHAFDKDIHAPNICRAHVVLQAMNRRKLVVLLNQIKAFPIYVLQRDEKTMPLKYEENQGLLH